MLRKQRRKSSWCLKLPIQMTVGHERRSTLRGSLSTAQRRTNLQRVTALDAHRAANEAATESVRLAARTAGDAAAAAYLHPIAKASQVGHILRGPASAARIAELVAGENPEVGEVFIERAKNHATPVLIDILSRYPIAPKGKNRVAHLMSLLDSKLRESR